MIILIYLLNHVKHDSMTIVLISIHTDEIPSILAKSWSNIDDK